MFLHQIFEGLRDPKDNPCWKGYHPVGTKKKNGKTVPNCVPNANEDIEESLADQIMQSARAAGLNPRLRGTPEQERERTQQMMSQRAHEREQQGQQAASADVSNLAELKAEYKQMKDSYESLGGSNWQYADREQNLTDSERRARSMEPALRALASRIHRAEQAQKIGEAVAAPAQPAAAPAQAAPAADPVQQKADQMQQSLLDRMGKRFGLPPGSSMEQVQAAQQAYLDKNDPAAAAQYKQNMTNIDAGNAAANKPVQLAPQASPATAQPAAAAPAKPNLGADFEAGLAAQKSGASPTEIMLAQPTIANNQQLLDVIAPTLGLPAGSTAQQLIAAARKRAVAEGEPGDLEHELNRQEYHHDKIAGRYEPDEFDQMVARLGQKAKEQERKHGPVDLAKLAQRLRDIK